MADDFVSEPTWVGDVIHFWFDELTKDQWFKRNKRVDSQIRDRFLPLHEQLLSSDAAGIGGPRSLLAAVIVLDQFSRNMFRGTARAYAADPIARRLARLAVESGFDAGMAEDERQFLYLPFEHSEDREDQALSVRLFATFEDKDRLAYAVAHKDIIDRFGRFPHRNAALNRTSTADEIALLKKPMSFF
jgi:uncharacterized protein (DUF924 family)